MRKILALLLMLPALASAQPYDNQVVELLVTYQLYEEYRPWAKHDPSSRRGSAVVVEGSLLLTEAQMIRDATLIQVRKHASARRVPARVVNVDQEVDLALLAVDEPGFFDDLQPVQIASELPTEGQVRSLRWKDRQLEVSNSRVARLEVKQSPFGSVHHLFLLLNTDLSGGGWAEPVFSNGSFVGLTVAQDEQHSSVIPAEVIEAYLERLASPEHAGFASFDMFWEPNPAPALSAYLGLPGEPRGALLREIPWGSTGCDVLQPRDLLLSLGGHEIDEVGNYAHPRYGQIRFQHLAVDGQRPGDVLSAEVLRGGEILDIEIPLRRHPQSQRLIPWRRDDSPPPYLVAAGLVIRELDGNYLRAWGDDWRDRAPTKLVQRYDLEKASQTPDRRRILILSHVLPDPYNVGYHDLGNFAIAAINGRPVDSIADAEEAFTRPENGLHRITFYPDDQRAEIFLDAAGFEEATARILASYNVPVRLRAREADVALAAAHCDVDAAAAPATSP